jgi:hypothetical protein
VKYLFSDLISFSISLPSLPGILRSSKIRMDWY